MTLFFDKPRKDVQRCFHADMRGAGEGPFRVLFCPAANVGRYVDGQVLVMHDMLGLNTEFSPRFLRRYHNLRDEYLKAFHQYVEDVKSGDFPNEQEQY